MVICPRCKKKYEYTRVLKYIGIRGNKIPVGDGVTFIRCSKCDAISFHGNVDVDPATMPDSEVPVI